MPVLHLVCGLPGAGKSTLGRRLEAELNAIRFAPDEWLHHLTIDFYDETRRAKIEELQWRLAQVLLASGTDVILENGFWSRKERDRYREVARRIGAMTKVHFLDVPIDELKDRLARRNASGHGSSPKVDPSRLDEWARMFEPPGADELR